MLPAVMVTVVIFVVGSVVTAAILAAGCPVPGRIVRPISPIPTDRLLTCENDLGSVNVVLLSLVTATGAIAAAVCAAFTPRRLDPVAANSIPL